MAATTTVVGVTAVAEAADAHLGQVVHATMAAELEETTEEVVAAALGADVADVRTAREAVPTYTAHRAPSARMRVRAPTGARSLRWRARGK